MRPIIKKAIIALALSTASGATFAGPSPESIAQCLVEKAKDVEVFEYGRQFGLHGEVRVTSGDVISCEGGVRVALDSKTRKASAEILPELLARSNQFRAGAYAAMLGEDAPMPAQQALGELGLLLEMFANRREDALNCLKAPEGMLKMMEETDAPFATAVIGVKVGIGNPAMAQVMALELIRRAGISASLSQLQTCDGEKDTEFREYAAHLDQFMKGTHPWAPGCKTTMDGAGQSLTCVGTP